MIKRLSILFGVVALLVSCSETVTYQIEGKLSNLEDPIVYVVFESQTHQQIDTVECSPPGHFVVNVMEGDFQTATLYLENQTCWLTTYLEPKKKVTITGNVEYPLLLNVKGGSPINQELGAFKKANEELLKELTTLSKGMASNPGDEGVYARYANVTHEMRERVKTFISKHSDEEASAVLINQFLLDPDDTRLVDEALAILDPSLQNSIYVKDLQTYSERAKATAIGAQAPEFNVTNIYGKKVALDSIAGKKLLLSFTAPWCEFCDTEDMFLDKIAASYPEEELQILLVTLDDNAKQVREVLAQDSIRWNLVADSSGQASRLVETYNVNALPRFYLIDEEGTIILKTDNGHEIKQTLDRLSDI